jgi:hypothetical protein
MTTPAERKQAERARKEAAGLRQVNVWVPDGMQDAIREAAERMVKDANPPA